MSIETTESKRSAHVLVIDDEPDLRLLYELTLLREGYSVDAASNLTQARQSILKNKYDAVITDMRLPDGLGLSLLRELGAQQRPERCVVMTAYGSAENAVEALKAGAFDYLTKPVDLAQFRKVVASAIAGTRQASSQPAPKNRDIVAAFPVQLPSAGLDKLIGDSSTMRAIKERIAKVARSMAPVLVRGESGSGKELVARAIHDCSHRAEGPFIAVNCGAIPDNLIEAEFFGAKKGSYTGSFQDREGYFKAATGGTLFLDEIGDLPLAMQSKLLRAIQERKVRPLGSTAEETLDVRIVSATHKDIGALVRTAEFRQDLYYRLNVIEIVVPSLRERRSDLPRLCEYLLARIAKESAIPVPTIEPSFYEELQAHPLEGNVRELENLLHRAVALSDGEALTGAVLREEPPVDALTATLGQAATTALAGGDSRLDLQAFLDNQERDILVQALQETGFNRTAAAERLGLTLRQIRYRMQRLGISVPNGEGNGADTIHAD